MEQNEFSKAEYRKKIKKFAVASTATANPTHKYQNLALKMTSDTRLMPSLAMMEVGLSSSAR